MERMDIVWPSRRHPAISRNGHYFNSAWTHRIKIRCFAEAKRVMVFSNSGIMRNICFHHTRNIHFERLHGIHTADVGNPIDTYSYDICYARLTGCI